MDRHPPPTPFGDPLPPPPGGLGIPPAPQPPPPKTTARSAALLGVLFAVGALLGVVGAVLLQGPGDDPDPCAEAGFVSSAFAYCVDPPADWSAWAADEVPSGVDTFRDGSDDTALYVEAARVEDGMDLEGFVTSVRATDTLDGFALTDQVAGTLGGVSSFEWDAIREVAGGDVVVREIVAVHGRLAYRLQITDEGSTGAPALRDARQLLDSWRFA